MITVWRYQLEPTGITRLRAPVGGEILTAQIDEVTGQPCIWIMVNTACKLQERVVELFSTEQEIKWSESVTQGVVDSNLKYIGTFQKGENSHHLFEYVRLDWVNSISH